MRRTTTALLLVLPLALAACQPAAEEADTGPAQATMAEVDQLRSEWVQLATAGDAAGVAGLYATDAVMMGADGQVMDGRQAIQQGLTFEGLTEIQVTPERTELGMDLISDWGTFSQTFETPEGMQTMNGRYMVVARRHADGAWRIVQHLSAPEPPAMPEEEATEGM